MTDSGKHPRRTIAIGDVHGCAGPLGALLERLRLGADDTLVVLGDVVDRGPDSRGAIDLLLRIGNTCEVVCLLGNHEQMLLESVDGIAPTHEWLIHGGTQTLDSYGIGLASRSIDPRHVDFIRSWRDYWECDTHFFAHGSYAPHKPLGQQPWGDLRWQSLQWLVPKPHISGKTAVVGHTANKRGEILNLGHLVCIDTYCHGGQWLTALDVGSAAVWQTNRDGAFREGKLPAAKEQYRPQA